MQRPQPSARGDLAKTPFAHLLIYALEKKLTGTLELSAPDGRTNLVLLSEGHATKARTAEPVAFLGRVLLELGFVSEDAVNQTLLEVAKTKALHGQLLLGRGAVDAAKLAKGLEVQLRRKLAHLFSLPSETTFAFFAGFDALEGWGGTTMVAVDPLPVVWRAICEAPPWDHVHAMLSRVQNAKLRVPPSAQIQRLELDDGARAVVDRLRAQPMRAVELASLGLTSPRVTQLLVYVLLVTKQVEIGETVTASPPPANVRPSQPPPAPRLGSTAPRPRDPMASASFGTASMRAPQSSQPGSMRAPKLPAPTPAPGSVQAIPRPAPVPTFGAGAGGGSKDLSPEHLARATEIRDWAAGIDKQDYFEMLGVARTATPEEVKTAFFALAKRWHPDRLPRELEVVREQCGRVFSRLGEAHSTLTDPEQRPKYMRLLSEGGATPDEQEIIAAVIDAATNFQKAEIYLKRNDLSQAEMLCRKAHEADKQQPDYIALLAWIESQKPENQTPKATQERIAMLDRSIAVNPNAEKAYFYRGHLHKRLGNDRQASRDFRKAAEINPRNVDATREVRIYEMRKGRNSTAPPPSGGMPRPPGDAKSGGILGKLFKK